MTRKSALLELVIVVAGVLIALSVDTVREWRNERALAAEARANLLSEIGENKQDLDKVLQRFDRAEAEFRKGHAAATNLLAGRPLGIDSLNFGFEMAELSAAAYATAEITGAFAFMDYADVREFSSLYDLQRQTTISRNSPWATSPASAVR